jgi:hypothetical protein
MALQTNKNGWYISPDGKRLNPKRYDENGNKIYDGGPKVPAERIPWEQVQRVKQERNMKKNSPDTIIYNGANRLFAGGSQNFNESTGKLREAIANNGNAVNADKLDFSKMYSQYSGGNFDAMKQAAQASLQNALSRLNPMRNSVELNKEQTLSGLRESLANQGDKGGIGRQDMLGVNTSAENQQNNIDLQEQDTINTTQADLLRQLIAENNRQEGIDIDESRYQDDRSRYEQERADEQSRYEDERSDIVQDREAEAADKALKSEIETMGRYYTDFQAEINRRTNSGDKSDDALIPYLQAARAEKIAKQLADADNSASQAYKNAYNMWLQLGVATPEVARILGIEAGAKTLDKVKAEYSTSKPYYNPNTGGGSSGNGLSW